MGFGILMINYRGSIGYGVDFLNSLSGNAFDYDVKDTFDLLSIWMKEFSNEIDENKIGIHGFSHGGYLACSVISHPDWGNKFAAACLINPAILMHAGYYVWDIPDWNNSTLLGKDHQWIDTKEDIMTMYDKSPISRVENVSTPSLFIIGQNDDRVPW